MFKFFILAGSYPEAVRFRLAQGWLRGDCFIIDKNNHPHGCHDIDVYCVGTYQSLPDLPFIENYLTTCNPRYFEIQGKFRVSLQQPLRLNKYPKPHSAPYKGGQQTKMPIKARIWWDSNLDAYTLSSSYSAKLVDALKQLIPAGGRDFDPVTKFWHVKEQYGVFLQQVCESAFGVGSVSFTSKNVTQQAGSQQAWSGSRSVSTTNPQTTEDALIAFMNLVPYEAAKKCYLVASNSLHPDRPTGDAQKMSRLNELWDRVEKEFYKR